MPDTHAWGMRGRVTGGRLQHQGEARAYPTCRFVCHGQLQRHFSWYFFALSSMRCGHAYDPCSGSRCYLPGAAYTVGVPCTCHAHVSRTRVRTLRHQRRHPVIYPVAREGLAQGGASHTRVETLAPGRGRGLVAGD